MKISIGFFSLIFLIFLTLKLCGVINWSWWLITLPLWGGYALILLILLIMFIIALFSSK